MMKFFLSLKTTVWTLLALIIVFFAGSSVMPMHRDIFGSLNELLLFRWLADVAIRSLATTWWFFLSIALLILLAINTVVCSIQAIRERWARGEYLLRISPQIVHIGFLFILLAHLLGAGWGYRLSGALPEGAAAELPDGRLVHLEGLQVFPDRQGFLSRWEARVSVYRNDDRPLFHEGTGIYLKSFDLERRPTAFLLVRRDPGALWALTGGILFSIGSVLLLVLKWRHA
jgi:hypothetical protein